MLTIIIIISIYLISLFSCYYLNKLLCKIDSGYPIMTVCWITPILNTFVVFLLTILVITNENVNLGIFSSEYWKNKWY